MTVNSTGNPSGVVLTVPAANIDEKAVRVAHFWSRYNEARRVALLMNEESRQYVYATDVDQTSGSLMAHKNRTHMPKLTEIADSLKTEYYDAALSLQKFFRYKADTTSNDDSSPAIDQAKKMETWVSSKLEQKKFRETTGRQLLDDYVTYGNCFVFQEYVAEKTERETILYKGPRFTRISPLDIVFNPRAQSFAKSPKVIKKLVHISDLMALPDEFPGLKFNTDSLNSVLEVRRQAALDDWVELIKERGLTMDGYGSWEEYFKQDLVETLTYFGSVYDPITGKVEQRQVMQVVDRMFVILQTENTAPLGFDGLGHAGWRTRPDNLWAQGPLDNLVGMQYRINHLENLKADAFDQIVQPVLKIQGEQVTEPEEGWAPGASYYVGIDSDVTPMPPNQDVLNVDTSIQFYIQKMDDFAGVPPSTQGTRTPGEKTAFEVQRLDNNASKKFVDKTRLFELMLERMLTETLQLMIKNYDGEDYVETTDDITGKTTLEPLATEDVDLRGRFITIGGRHWTVRNRLTLEMRDFLMGPAQTTLIGQHTVGLKIAEFFERVLDFDEVKFIEPFGGVKEQVQGQAVAEAEAAKFQENLGDNSPVPSNREQAGSQPNGAANTQGPTQSVPGSI